MAAIVNETARSDEELAAEIARRDASERAFRAAGDAFDGLYRRHAPLLLEEFRGQEFRGHHTHLPQEFRGQEFRGHHTHLPGERS